MTEETYIMGVGQYVVTIGSGGAGRNSGTAAASNGRGNDSLVNPNQSVTATASINGYDDTIGVRGGGSAGPGGSGSYATARYWTNYNGGSGAGLSAITQTPAREVMGSYVANEGTSGQGNAGGGFVTYGGSSTFTGGGGGGGAGGWGGTAPQGGGPIGAKGGGGSGKESNIRGSLETFAGGGGGGYGSWDASNPALGGAGGGGNGGTRNSTAPTAGGTNTGGGGGGGAWDTGTLTGSNGGSGIVVFRYRFQG